MLFTRIFCKQNLRRGCNAVAFLLNYFLKTAPSDAEVTLCLYRAR